jgi:ribosomal protein L4
MVQQPWTTRPFEIGQDLQLPVYNLIEGEFTGELCNLDSTYFNNPLRRDIVSKVFHYFQVKGVKLNKYVLRKGDVAGSGKKPFPQKGRGASR